MGGHMFHRYNNHNSNHNINNNRDIILILIILVSIIFVFVMSFCYHKPINIRLNTEYNVENVIFSEAELDDTDNCAICMEKLNTGKILKINCDHIFHDKCVKTWSHTNIFLKRDSKCPLCNYVYYEY